MNMTNFATRLIAGAILTTLISSLSAIASAADGMGVPQKTVKYADLNVSSVQGAARLYNRIQFAAEEVCSPLSHGDPFSKMHAKAWLLTSFATNCETH